MVILLIKLKTCDEICDPTPIHVAEQDRELLRNYWSNHVSSVIGSFLKSGPGDIGVNAFADIVLTQQPIIFCLQHHRSEDNNAEYGIVILFMNKYFYSQSLLYLFCLFTFFLHSYQVFLIQLVACGCMMCMNTFTSSVTHMNQTSSKLHAYEHHGRTTTSTGTTLAVLLVLLFMLQPRRSYHHAGCVCVFALLLSF